MGSEFFEETLELVFSNCELLAAGEIGLIGQGVVKFGKSDFVQHRCDAEIDESQRIHIRELHTRAILAVELRRAPLFCARIAVDGGLFLATDILGNAKVGQIHPAGLEQDIRRLYIEMANVVVVAVGHCASRTANNATEELIWTSCKRVHVLRDSRWLNCAQVVDLQCIEPSQDVLAVSCACAYRV